MSRWRVVHTYKSKDRDMFFHVTSTLEAAKEVLGSFPVYEPVIYDDHEICESNQAADDFWREHEFDKDFYNYLARKPLPTYVGCGMNRLFVLAGFNIFAFVLISTLHFNIRPDCLHGYGPGSSTEITCAPK